jgi:hypothetical protein
MTKDELLRILMEAVVAKVRCYPLIYLRGVSNTTEISGQSELLVSWTIFEPSTPRVRIYSVTDRLAWSVI